MNRRGDCPKLLFLWLVDLVSEGIQLLIKLNGVISGTIAIVLQGQIDSGGPPLLMSRGFQLVLVTKDGKHGVGFRQNSPIIKGAVKSFPLVNLIQNLVSGKVNESKSAPQISEQWDGCPRDKDHRIKLVFPQTLKGIFGIKVKVFHFHAIGLKQGFARQRTAAVFWSKRHSLALQL